VPPDESASTALSAQWLHEIKHDGCRVVARKDGARLKLYSGPGNDFMRSRSCIIDGEAVCCD
jgi:ATP-dependent DNA ligase